MENILDGLRLCRRHCREAMNVSTALAIVNMAVLQKDASHTLETMKHRLDIYLTGIYTSVNAAHLSAIKGGTLFYDLYFSTEHTELIVADIIVAYTVGI